MNVGIVTCTRCERKESVINGVFKLIFIIQCDCSIKSNSPVFGLIVTKNTSVFFFMFSLQPLHLSRGATRSLPQAGKRAHFVTRPKNGCIGVIFLPSGEKFAICQ